MIVAIAHPYSSPGLVPELNGKLEEILPPHQVRLPLNASAARMAFQGDASLHIDGEGGAPAVLFRLDEDIDAVFLPFGHDHLDLPLAHGALLHREMEQISREKDHQHRRRCRESPENPAVTLPAATADRPAHDPVRKLRIRLRDRFFVQGPVQEGFAVELAAELALAHMRGEIIPFRSKAALAEPMNDCLPEFGAFHIHPSITQHV